MLIVSCVYAQEEVAPQLNVEKLTENIAVIWDMANGNSAVLTGEDGTFLIDTKSGAAAQILLAKISEISTQPGDCSRF